MFWSKNSRTVASKAGTAAPHRAQVGKSNNGIHQGRPVVVANCVGSLRTGKAAAATPYFNRAARATSEPKVTPMAGAKLERLLRNDLVKYVEVLSPFSVSAEPNVTMEQTSVNSALVATDAGEVNVFATSVMASKRKMELIKTLKISSVKRVRYCTILHVDVRAAVRSMPEVQIPVQA
mmetsp:Transcript_13229/g.19496  ORF Transcript_13229/g.19496 Transcript_13229/m.19496 type:complete len:178 (-) Transcript_13229:65-598(-)